MPAPPPQSLIDRVDERDQVIGVVRRRNALAQGANFRTCHVFVFDGNGRLLLQRIGARHQRSAGLLGSSVAAYLHAGETYREAAVRRTSEELGLDVDPIAFGRTVMHDEQSLKFITLFTCTADRPRRLARGHVAAARYVPLAAIDRMVRRRPQAFTGTFRHVYEFFRAGRA